MIHDRLKKTFLFETKLIWRQKICLYFFRLFAHTLTLPKVLMEYWSSSDFSVDRKEVLSGLGYWKPNKMGSTKDPHKKNTYTQNKNKKKLFMDCKIEEGRRMNLTTTKES